MSQLAFKKAIPSHLSPDIHQPDWLSIPMVKSLVILVSPRHICNTLLYPHYYQRPALEDNQV